MFNIVPIARYPSLLFPSLIYFRLYWVCSHHWCDSSQTQYILPPSIDFTLFGLSQCWAENNDWVKTDLQNIVYIDVAPTSIAQYHQRRRLHSKHGVAWVVACVDNEIGSKEKKTFFSCWPRRLLRGIDGRSIRQNIECSALRFEIIESELDVNEWILLCPSCIV